MKDCLDCKGFLSTDARDEVCFNRKLLNGKDNPNTSYLWRDIVGMLVWFLSAGIATACGVGGGGIYVPLGMLLLNFAPKPSSGLSQASIFGASIGGMVLNFRNHHPFATKISKGQLESVPSNKQTSTEGVQYFTRPLIDFDITLFLAPLQMAGALLGVLVQRIVPNWLYLTSAAIILSYTAHRTFKKFRESHAKEAAARLAAKTLEKKEEESSKESESPEDIAEKAIGESAEEDCVPPKIPCKSGSTITADEQSSEPNTEQNSDLDNAEKKERCMYWLKKDSCQYPSEKITGLIVLWMGLTILTFLQGGKGIDSIIGITCSSPWYPVLIAAQFIWAIGISTFYGFRLVKQTKDKVACDFPYHPHDVIWNYEMARFYALFTFIAGAVAGLIGVGGGMFLGPLMLVNDIYPLVSSATNGVMVVLTSSTVAVMFVTAGLVPWQYAVTFFFVCLAGAWLGKSKIDAHVKKTGRASILILLLASIIAFATIGCIVIVVTRLNAADWCFAGFNKFCTVSGDDDEGGLCPMDRMLFGEH